MKINPAVVLFVGLSFLAGQPRAEEGIPWLENPAAALKAAAESGKPVVVDVWAVWCVPCKEMDASTYRDPRVVEAIGRFVPLKVDADVQTIFVDRYGIEAYPTVLFLDAEGTVVSSRSGFVNADAMLSALTSVEKGYSDYVAALRAANDDPTAARRAAAYLIDTGNPDGAIDILKRAIRDVPKRDPALREWMELDIAKAMVTAGDASGAVSRCNKLAASAVEPDVRAAALVVIVRAEKERGRDDKVADALSTLRTGWPEVAASEFGEPSGARAAPIGTPGHDE